MRFCTSELKTSIICRALVQRFPGQTILSATGIRRQESPNRAKAPVAKQQPKLASASRRTQGLDWHPILDWTTQQVFAYLEEKEIPLHEAYTRYGYDPAQAAHELLKNVYISFPFNPHSMPYCERSAPKPKPHAPKSIDKPP